MSAEDLSQADREFLRARGTSPDRFADQLELYRREPPAARLVRAATPGDGIVVTDAAESNRLEAVYDSACQGLDILKFTPASGAASRMFRALIAVASGPARDRGQLEADAPHDGDAAEALRVLDHLDDFAFRDRLLAELKTLGPDPAQANPQQVLCTLLENDGLGYAGLPKGLLHFHRDGDHVRTPVEEHLYEAAAYGRGRGGLARVHFTVSPEHRRLFEELVANTVPEFERRFGLAYEVTFSEQHPSTDSVAVHPDGEPFRDEQGQLLFRPAGHGALIENLADLEADLIFVKNIDNVVPERRASAVVQWKKVLAGYLIERRQAVTAALAELDQGVPGGQDRAAALLQTCFGLEVPSGVDRLQWLRDRLDRPMRVCGMVANEGEPGGGPFWVEDPRTGEVALQIVEGSQVDRSDSEQNSILASATHFNPVDLVCSTRRADGSAYDLARFVDHDAVFIADKSWQGRPLRSLELPGLWNGAMGAWNTVFVDVPIQTFEPVKALVDLLRPAHLPLRPEE